MAANKSVNTNTAAEDEGSEWEELRYGIGNEWDFESNGPLVGNFLGTSSMDVDGRDTNYHQFAPADDPADMVFLWGSAQLDSAFNNELVRVGDRVKVSYLGKTSFTSKDGPRQMKKYRVQYAKKGI